MNSYRYRVFYEYAGPTKGDPFRREKTEDQIQDALDRVSTELAVYLDDDEAQISTTPDGKNSMQLVVRTTTSRDLFNKALAKCLSGLDLFGKEEQP